MAEEKTKDGIKLSNLYLRDGNNNWNSLSQAYIGDMVGNGDTKEQVQSVQLKQFLTSVYNFMTGGSGGTDTVTIPEINKFKLIKSGPNISLIYEKDPVNPIVLGSVADMNTLYAYNLEYAVGEDGQIDYIQLVNNAETGDNRIIKTIAFPEINIPEPTFTVYQGIGKFSS